MPTTDLAAADLDIAGTARCLVEAWRYLTSQYPGHIVAHDGPVAVALSQTNCPFFNMIVIDQPVADSGALHRAMTTARAYADRCPHDAMLLVCPEWLPPVADAVLADAGLSFSMSLSGMATDRLAPPRRDAPALDFRIVRDAQTALNFGRVNADAYGMPHEIFGVTGNIHHWSGTQVGAVGYADGRAVTAALAYLLADRIYVVMVATLPDQHGKGYAEAAMRCVIAAAQEAGGERRLWLHATEMGRPLYRAMGFADGARMDLYAFGSQR